MDAKMFCYQCEQTLGGKGCTKAGVCGKDADVAALQDLLIYNLKGLAFWGQRLLDKGENISHEVQNLMTDAMFSTLTNVNFDPERFFTLNSQAEDYKKQLREQVGPIDQVPEAATYVSPKRVDLMIEDGHKVGIMADQCLNEDIRSLRELLIYGLKGVSAYVHQAGILGNTSEEVNHFFFKALDETLKEQNGIDEYFALNMELGQKNLIVMGLLDSVHTGTYGHPVPTQVAITKKKGPFIVISGHDLKDLEMLLQQTEGKGVNVYTHGEMIPAHGYPELKKYKHLAGNYGGAWQDQQKEFDNLPGCILMTTNCLQKPRPSYEDRIYTTSVVGWPGITHIEAAANGYKDFSQIIEKAIELGGFSEDEPEKTITVGFGHNTTLSHAGTIIDAVKSGAIKHFFLIGGCDGARPGRNYFTEFAEKTPDNTVILTLACGKYRFNKLDFGTIGGLPRLLDVGQCNDAYSAIKIAVALAEAFECDVNDLPLSMVLSWYEQKAVAILLTLLSLNIKNILLGPSLPAFISPNVLQVLVDKFNISPISDPESDLQKILG